MAGVVVPPPPSIVGGMAMRPLFSCGHVARVATRPTPFIVAGVTTPPLPSIVGGVAAQPPSYNRENNSLAIICQPCISFSF
jgi:hypothetical protein